MATPPTFSAFQQSPWTDTTATLSEATPSLSWTAGDLIVVAGATEDNTNVLLGVPTATGLTFSQITATNTASNGKCYLWSAVAGSTSSGAISSVISGPASGTSAMCGIAAFAITGSDGLGSNTLMAGGGTTNATTSLTRGFDNSGVIGVMVDWNAVADVAVTTAPSTNGTVRIIARDAGGTHARFYLASWGDQSAAGASSYGIASDTATPKWIGAFVEIKGAAGGASFLARRNPSQFQAVKRASFY